MNVTQFDGGLGSRIVRNDTFRPTYPTKVRSLPLGGVVADRYSLLSLLGQGGHADVWEVFDGVTNERVALKLMRTDVEPARVRREISALRLLAGPGVVRLLDEGTDRGRQFLVMERVGGAPFPGKPGRRGWRDLAGVTLALLNTLERIHAAGVIHRDIKPSNLLVTTQGRVTLLDFGLAHGVPGDTTFDHGLGTPCYMAPEQVREGAITPRADLFALGVMLYEVLAGRLPHEAENLHAVFFQKMFGPPTPLQDLAPGVPPMVALMIHRMMAGSPAERPRSAGEVKRLLRGEGTRHVDSNACAAGCP